MAGLEQQAAGMLDLLASHHDAQQAAAAPAEGTSAEGEGEPAAKGGRKRASARQPDERLAAVQEKNRKAQKRFRERQKAKMSEMEEELEKAKAEMTQLREQNSALAGRNAVLEKVLALREDQLKSFQAGNPDGAQPALGGLQQPALAALNYSQPATAPQRATSGFMALPPPQQGWTGLPGGGAFGVGALTGGSGGGSAAPVTPTAAAAAAASAARSPEETGKWLEYVQELSRLTGAARKPGGASDEDTSRLEDLVQKAAILSARSTLTAGSSGQAGPGAADPARWRSVTANLNVTAEQRQQVQQLQAAHQQRLQELRAAREELAAAAHASPTGDRSGALETFKRNLQQEADATEEFVVSLFTQVLTPLQFGRAAVQSYPFYVDGLAIADLLSSDGKLSPGGVGSSSSAFGALVQLVVPSMPPQLTSSLFAHLGSASQPLPTLPSLSGLGSGSGSYAPAISAALTSSSPLAQGNGAN